MILAGMIREDEDALICDFAEEYHVFDYRGLPVRLRATLAAGLRQNSRIKMKLSGIEYPLETLLLAKCADHLAILAWQNTEDGQRGRNVPELALPKLLGQEKRQRAVVFDSPEEFEALRAKIVGIEGG